MVTKIGVKEKVKTWFDKGLYVVIYGYEMLYVQIRTLIPTWHWNRHQSLFLVGHVEWAFADVWHSHCVLLVLCLVPYHYM